MEEKSDRELYTIPTRSGWFNWDEIHEIERTELPEFFDFSSFSRNPRIYKEYRDFIINKYREDESKLLTFTEIRRCLIGHVGSILRVFRFLERWGLINFSAVDKKSSFFDRKTVSFDGGECLNVVFEDGLPSAVKIVNGFSSSGTVTSNSAHSAAVGSEIGSKLPPLSSYLDVFGDCAVIDGRICGNCGDGCSSGYYEAKSGIVICIKCFESAEAADQKAALGYEFHDQKVESGRNLGGEWTERETLSLLEAIVSKGTDWDLIANHVRRNKLDCIGKLIQLPFGEHIVSENGKLDKPAEEAAEEMLYDSQANYADEEIIEKPTKKRKLITSLADICYSLQEQVAFLSTIAGPDVTSAAASAAISALCEGNPFAKKVFRSDKQERNKPTCPFPSDHSPVSDVKAEPYDEAEMGFGQSIVQMRAAAATALAATAAHAKLLADQEQRQIDFLMAMIIDLQMKKMRHKMKHFGDLESIMEQEYMHLQQIKESIIQEWIDISQRALAAGIPRWKDPALTKPSVPAPSTIA